MPLENIVGHYGLHLQPLDGVQYLVQDGFKGDNFVGLPDRPPYEVRSRYFGPSPHIFPSTPAKPNPNDWDAFMGIFQDPLVQALLPIPKRRQDKVPFFYDEKGDINRWIFNLCRMSNPKGSLAMSGEKIRTYALAMHLCASNIAPLVLTNISTKAQQVVDEVARTAIFLPRKLVLTGPDSHFVVRDPIERQTSQIGSLISEEEFMMLPLELLGAQVLRKYARGEEIK